MKFHVKSLLLSALLVSSSFLSSSASAVTAIELAPQSFSFTDGLAVFNSVPFSQPVNTYFHETITFTGLAAGIYDIDASISGVNLAFTASGTGSGVWLDGHAYHLSDGSAAGKLKSGNIQYTGGAPLTLDVYGYSTVARNSFFNGSITVMAAPVPEPDGYAMMAGGLALLGAVSRRSAKRRAA